MSEKDIKLIEEMKDNCVKQANYVDVKAMDKYNALRNLQQENHDLKEQVECLIKQRDDISANAVETIEKYQQENKYLKLTNPEQNIEHFRMLKENKIKIDNLRRQNKDLKQQIGNIIVEFGYKKEKYKIALNECQECLEEIKNHYKELINETFNQELSVFVNETCKNGFILNIISYLDLLELQILNKLKEVD